MRARQRHLNPKDAGATIVLDARFLNQADNSSVSTWTNRTGANNFTASDSGQPLTFKTNSINGQPAVLFNLATNNGLKCDIAGGNWYSNSRIFLSVIKFNSYSNAYNAIYDDYTTSGAPSGSTPGATMLIKSNGKLAFYWVASNGSQPNYDGTGSNTLNTSSPFIITMVNGPSIFQSFVNGSSDTSTTTATTPAAGTNVGILGIGYSRLFPARPIAANLGMMLVINNSSSNSLRKRLQNSAAFSFKLACS